jgi:Zn-dependent peptidase ImmA (M78 family)
MGLSTRSQVEQFAKEVLVQHGLYSVPVDPVDLASKLGVTVHNAKFADDSLAGLIAKRGDNAQILVEQSDPPYRKRFSIAHELGHHFLHLLQDGHIIDRRVDMFREKQPAAASGSSHRNQEIEANWFAAALLMPEDLVRLHWAENPSVTVLARVFNVSEEAMGYRVDALDLEVAPHVA